jgi:hypothetical protein
MVKIKNQKKITPILSQYIINFIVCKYHTKKQKIYTYMHLNSN